MSRMAAHSNTEPRDMVKKFFCRAWSVLPNLRRYWVQRCTKLVLIGHSRIFQLKCSAGLICMRYENHMIFGRLLVFGSRRILGEVGSVWVSIFFLSQNYNNIIAVGCNKLCLIIPSLLNTLFILILLLILILKCWMRLEWECEWDREWIEWRVFRVSEWFRMRIRFRMIRGARG